MLKSSNPRAMEKKRKTKRKGVGEKIRYYKISI